MPTPKDPDRLTLKQRRFAEALPTARSQADAARIAGYTEKSIRKVATTNLANSSIMAVVHQHLATAAEAAGVDAVYVLKGLKEHREEARAEKQYGPANTALELIGKHLRLFGEDKAAPPGDTYNQVVLQGYTVQELRALLKAMQHGDKLDAAQG